jgi:hypothetical protein
MPNRDQFPAVFARLKAVLEPYAPNLVVTADAPDLYALDAPPSPRFPQGVFFGQVKIGKSYVSFHLMPVYMFPDLLADLPAALRKRMQGKSCFNFTTLDDAAVDGLARLAAASVARVREAQQGASPGPGRGGVV